MCTRLNECMYTTDKCLSRVWIIHIHMVYMAPESILVHET